MIVLPVDKDYTFLKPISSRDADYLDLKTRLCSVYAYYLMSGLISINEVWNAAVNTES